MTAPGNSGHSQPLPGMAERSQTETIPQAFANVGLYSLITERFRSGIGHCRSSR